jgi:Flp pilus assembly protein TadG
MTTSTFIQKLRNGLHAFRTAERGNVVFMFALGVIPMIGFIGSAIDYSRANSARSAMQSAVDATALMLSKDITTLTSAQISQKATAYFNALYNRPEVAGVTITPTYTAGSGAQLVVNGSGTLNTTFMKAMGLQSLAINVSSTVKWGNTRLRVALVLDNTGSMADAGKITALKTATKGLLSMLQASAANNGDVYVSIIPFSRDVNVGGPSNYNANWIDWSDWDAANGTLNNGNNGNGNGNNGNGNNGNGNGNGNGGGTWVPANHNTWNGCITDRGTSNAPSPQNYDTNVSPPVVGNAATLFPAEQYNACPVEMMGLTYNWTQLNQKVDAMYPNGNTNQAIGLAWGWLSLVGGGPFTVPAKDPNYKYNEVIILLSDGLNTQDRWYSDQASIDARQQITCNNVKAAGYTLYTVHVNTDGDPTSQLLKNCASDPSKFFILTSASGMVTTFNQIGTQLSNLRVAK